MFPQYSLSGQVRMKDLTLLLEFTKSKDHHKNGTNCLPAWHAMCNAARLSKRQGSVWNCLWGHALKRSLGINRKSRVSYPGPGFLSSATWHSLPKKHFNGLINQSLINQSINQSKMKWYVFEKKCA